MDRKHGRSLAGVAALLAAGALGLFSFGTSSVQMKAASNNAARRPTGEAQLVSVVPFASEGEMCQWEPANASTTLLASMQGQAAAAADGTVRPVERPDMKPIRMIKDPYAAYSSVAVDPYNDEVVMTDENLFQILVYDRTANTPPTAKLTEPKRMIGGSNTKIEFQCGLYIDPTNGDIFAVNNDTVDTLVIFNRQAKGNVPPTREVHTPHGTFGIAVDEDTQEMFLTTQHDNTVTVFKKMAKGEDTPIRMLQGNHTRLADPHSIVIDTKNQLMYVTNHGSYHDKEEEGEASVSYVGGIATGTANKAIWPVGTQKPGSGKYLPPSINVYPLKASGDTPPLRVIQGSKTRMNWPTGLALDVERGELIVANDMGDELLIFDTNATGDAAPKAVLKGPKTMLKNPTGVWLDLHNNELWSANFGNHTATVYKRGATGDTAPLRVIRGGPLDEPSLGIGNPHPVGYDTKREEILVPNCVAHPQIASFPRLADANTKPTRKLEGQKTGLGRTMHSIEYDPIHDEYSVPQPFSQAILTFRGGATGEEAPIRILQGPKTMLDSPERLALDPVHDEIFVPQDNRVLVYPRSANGDVAPLRELRTGPGAEALGIDAVHNFLVVAGATKEGSRFKIYDRTAKGDDKPLRVIGGSKSLFYALGGPFTVYGPKGWIISTVRGVGALGSPEAYMGIWSVNDDGDVPPRWRIGGPRGIFQLPRGVVVDAKNKSIIASDKRLNAVLTFYFPEAF